VARRRERLEALARQLERDHGVGVQVVACDLTDRKALGELEERIESDSDLDLVVNNAGVADFGHFIERDRDSEEKQIQLDVVALVRLTHAAVPAMVKRGHGAVINVSSVAGLTPGPCWAVYAAGKSFVNAFTQALQLEIHGTGVRLQALCPGLTRTELFDEAGADASALPGFLWMRPEEVVDASIAALERDTVICVPGLGYQAFTTLGAWLPATLSGQIASFINERAIKVPAQGGSK